MSARKAGQLPGSAELSPASRSISPGPAGLAAAQLDPRAHSSGYDTIFRPRSPLPNTLPTPRPATQTASRGSPDAPSSASTGAAAQRRPRLRRAVGRSAEGVPRGSRHSLSAAAGPASKVAQPGPRAGRGWRDGRKRRAAVARARGLVLEAPDSSPRGTFVCGALGAQVCSLRRERRPPLRSSQGDKLLHIPAGSGRAFPAQAPPRPPRRSNTPTPIPCSFPAGRCAPRAGQKNPGAPGGGGEP